MSAIDGLVPIVDLGELGLRNENDPSEKECRRVGSEITQVFMDIGFVYLTSHGIPDSQISALMSSGEKFFDLDQETKDKYSRDAAKQGGYVAPNREIFNRNDFPHELRESFEVKFVDGKLPDDEVPSLRPNAEAFISSCKTLSRRLMKALALGLNLEESFFLDKHREICSDNNASVMRLLHYPPVHDAVPPNSIRCGAHTDFGTFTFLIQDNVGGLQVKERGGQWVNADPVPNTVLVNVGNILQFWTSGKFVANEHRVLIPKEEKRLKVSRRSLAFFLYPDDEVLVKPFDSSSTFTPITAREYFRSKLIATYDY